MVKREVGEGRGSEKKCDFSGLFYRHHHSDPVWGGAAVGVVRLYGFNLSDIHIGPVAGRLP